MLNYLAAYGATAVAMLALDLVWLGAIAKSFYWGASHESHPAPV